MGRCRHRSAERGPGPENDTIRLRPGDIGLEPARGIIGLALRLIEWIGGIPHQEYGHTFMVDQEEGQWWNIEAAFPRVRRRRLRMVEGLVFVRPKGTSEEQAALAVAFARQQEGKWYGVGKAGLVLWTWIMIALRRVRIAETYFCWELCVTSWRMAGKDITPGREARDLRASDIAGSEEVQRVNFAK